jgi:hypothetical protein
MYCTDWYQPSPDHPQQGERGTQAAFYTSKLWEPGQTITIGFFGAPPVWKRAWIKKVVGEKVQPFVNLKLVFDDHVQAGDLRISCDPTVGSASQIGTDSTLFKHHASMNLGWLNEPPEEFTYQGQRYETDGCQVDVCDGTGRVIVHEFGHALGMIHEHQTPADGMQWDEQAAYDHSAGPPTFWDPNVTLQQVLRKYSKDWINSSQFDKHSVMMYDIPPHILTNKLVIPHNTEFSPTDKQWLRGKYGTPPGTRKRWIAVSLVATLGGMLALLLLGGGLVWWHHQKVGRPYKKLSRDPVIDLAGRPDQPVIDLVGDLSGRPHPVIDLTQPAQRAGYEFIDLT